ncbi:lantibiotic dehydratase [Kitasatospora cineracea]|uniref:lantibiotic dehydratase n=1 Tax=Kitasatospora cineracea TaxID=88074 RepID=UPI0037F7A3DA
MWADRRFAEAVELAGPALALSITDLLAAERPAAERGRRAALSTARYILRAQGRPTPFGLFAGVQTAAARSPVRFQGLVDKTAAEFPSASAGQVTGLLSELLAQGALVSSLRAPATEPDPRTRLLRALERAGVRQTSEAAGLAVDLRLDARIALPGGVAEDAARTAALLARLSPLPQGATAWRLPSAFRRVPAGGRLGLPGGGRVRRLLPASARPRPPGGLHRVPGRAADHGRDTVSAQLPFPRHLLGGPTMGLPASGPALRGVPVGAGRHTPEVTEAAKARAAGTWCEPPPSWPL